jgi:acetyl esterase
MPLDPQLQHIVDAVNGAAASAPPVAEQTVQMLRDGYLALAGFAGAGPELDSVVNTTMPGPAGDIPVRIYANDGAKGIFVFYHGGGCTIGDLDTHDEVCRQLALESGSTLIAVHYRLAPEAPFPGGVDDAWAALQHIDANRGEYGGSADAKIVVGGDSAGGNFSAVMALMARDAGLALAAQLLVYPCVRMDDESPSMAENAEGYVLSRETMDWFGEQYAADPRDWRASPIEAASHAGVAPAVVITAEFDPLRDQGAEYARKLEDAGVDVEHALYEGMVHIFFQLGPIVGKAAQAVSQIAEAAKKALA